MIDLIIIVILLCIIAAIVFCLCREKKRGAACVGCPYAKQCAKNKSDHHDGAANRCCGNTKESK